MTVFVKYNSFNSNLGLGVFNLNTDTLKVALTNTTPNAATHTVLADITEISAGNGYTAGGDDAQNAYSESGGIGTLTGVDITYVASGGNIGPFRYAVLYDDTPTSPADPLIAYYDHGASITLVNGSDFTVDFGASILTIV
jgi:hypothetical protein